MSRLESTTLSTVIMESSAARQKPSLLTLPPEVKNQIFSHFLLGSRVKHFTDGNLPGYKYKFDATIMRTNKQLREESDDYLRSHNEFVLIHIRFVKFKPENILLPLVATGKAARSFRNPCLEGTIDDKLHAATKKVSRVLLLFENLHHFCRQLQLVYHVWPSLPIYIHSTPNNHPVVYSPSEIETPIKVVWKLSKSHRQDLTNSETRIRQNKLITPIAGTINYGQKVTFHGFDESLASKAIQSMTPRVVYREAVGWNLYQNMQKQKGFLDDILAKNPLKHKQTGHAYLKLAILTDDTTHLSDSMREHKSAHVLNIPYSSNEPEKIEDAALGRRPKDWPTAVANMGFECMLSALALVLDYDDDDDDENVASPLLLVYSDLMQFVQWHRIIGNALYQELTTLSRHFTAWQSIFSAMAKGTVSETTFQISTDNIASFLEMNELLDPQGDELLTEDVDYMRKVAGRELPLPKSPSSPGCCPGLKRRRAQTLPRSNLVGHDGYEGWTSIETESLEPELRKRIIEASDEMLLTGKLVEVEGCKMDCIYDR